MSDLIGVTLKEFNEMVESMRKVYPFEDDKTRIVDTIDRNWNAHMKLDIHTYDEENKVHVRLSKEARRWDEDE